MQERIQSVHVDKNICIWAARSKLGEWQSERVEREQHASSGISSCNTSALCHATRSSDNNGVTAAALPLSRASMPSLASLPFGKGSSIAASAAARAGVSARKQGTCIASTHCTK